MSSEQITKEKLRDPLSGDIMLSHYNWSQFNEYIINAQQARFGAAGEELVKGKEIDWIAIKPLATDYNLRPSLLKKSTDLLSEARIENVTISNNNNFNNNSSSGEIQATRSENQLNRNLTSLLDTTGSQYLFDVTSAVDTESTIELEGIVQATTLSKNVVSEAIDVESMAKLRKELQVSLNKLQADFSGNIAGLQAYSNEINSWRND
jgi:hypothetical protein